MDVLGNTKLVDTFQEEGETVGVVALQSFCVDNGRDCVPGDELRLPASRVRRLLAVGWVAPLTKEVAG